MPNNFIKGIAYAFLDRILSFFGALANVFKDQVCEFLGEFQALCKQVMINCRTASRDHPEADGLA